MNDANTMIYERSITNIIEKRKGRGDSKIGFLGIIEGRNHNLGEKI